MPTPAPRAVVTVFDGLRPDFVTPELTPNILRAAARGTWFREARSVFPSVTRVATSAIATGAPPAVHGVVGNSFYYPAALPGRILDTGKRADLDAGERAAGGRLIDADTFGDRLAADGLAMSVVHTGSAGSCHAINPRAARNGQWTLSTVGEAFTPTPDAVRDTVERFGPLPARTLPRGADQDYAARVMVERVLPAKPAVALAWFSEPDTSFHYLGIGTDGAATALRTADRALGAILDWIEAQPDADAIALVVASDHGQISTRAAVPLLDEAVAAGFGIARGEELGDARFALTGGSSGGVWRRSGDPAELDALAAWMMEHEAVSHVFSRGGAIPGTLPLDAVGQGHARSADLMYVLRSDLSPDGRGAPGLGLFLPCEVPVGGGYHGGLNPHELNTVLIVSAPERIAAGALSREPAGIVDIAPTLLDAVGVAPASTMRGRSLLRPAADEARTVVHEAGRGAFTQRVVTVEQGRRSLIRHGGQPGAA